MEYENSFELEGLIISSFVQVNEEFILCNFQGGFVATVSISNYDEPPQFRMPFG